MPVRPKTDLRRPAAVTALLAAALAAGWAIASPALAAQPPVELHSADAFAVLAGAGITNTGPTTVDGDMGTFPTTTETGLGSVTFAAGSNDSGDGVTQTAKGALGVAYGDAAGRTPPTDVPTELGGTTLGAGVYASPTLGLTGTVTLDANGNPAAVFIFQAGSTLITASQSHVLLTGGASACNVIWQVGSSATFGTDSQFAGNVLAHTSITATTGATFQGRLLADTGAVTLDTNTITAPDCAAAPPTSPSPSPTSTPTPTTSVSSSPGSPAPSPSTTPVASPITSQPAGAPGSASVAPERLLNTDGANGTGTGQSRTSELGSPTGALTTSHGTDRPAESTALSTAGSPELPFTGSDTLELLALSSGLLLSGVALLTAGRRRR